jgi:hypothetical protein
MARWVVLGLAFAACGGGAEGFASLPEERGQDVRDARSGVVVGNAGDEENEPEREPCYRIEPEVTERWPGADDALLDAAARWWRWYRPSEGDEACELEVVAITAESPLVVEYPDECDRACSNVTIVRVRIDVATTVAGPQCERPDYRLADVLTHELGHLFDLRDSDSGAMGYHAPCETIAPTRSEIRAANRCRDDGPPVGAECPE